MWWRIGFILSYPPAKLVPESPIFDETYLYLHTIKRVFTPYPAVELDQKCSLWWRSNATMRRNEVLWSFVMLQHCLKDNCLVVPGITITMLDMMAFVTNQYTERLLHSVWIWWTDTLQIASLGCLASFHTMAAHLGGVSTYTSRMMIVALVYLCM